MARRKTSTTTTEAAVPVAYRYSPGDGHTYTWDGGEYAAVYRHDTTDGVLAMAPVAGEAVYMAGVARTASAFAEAVDLWRVGSPAPGEE